MQRFRKTKRTERVRAAQRAPARPPSDSIRWAAPPQPAIRVSYPVAPAQAASAGPPPGAPRRSARGPAIRSPCPVGACLCGTCPGLSRPCPPAYPRPRWQAPTRFACTPEGRGELQPRALAAEDLTGREENGGSEGARDGGTQRDGGTEGARGSGGGGSGGGPGGGLIYLSSRAFVAAVVQAVRLRAWSVRADDAPLSGFWWVRPAGQSFASTLSHRKKPFVFFGSLARFDPPPGWNFRRAARIRKAARP